MPSTDSLLTSALVAPWVGTVAVALVAGISGWLVRNSDKKWERRLQSRNEKVKRYEGFLTNLQGFTLGAQLSDAQGAKRMKDAFLLEVNFAWLYCPDDVIKKAYAFLDLVHTNRTAAPTDEQKELALGKLMAAIREDMLALDFPAKSSLTPKDFRVLTST